MSRRLGRLLALLLVLVVVSGTAGAVLAASRKTSSIVGFPAYNTNGYTLHPWFNQYYWDRPPDYNCLRDSSGVCVDDVGGVIYQQPAAQAMDGMWAVDQFQQTGDVSQLDLAEAEAGRLLSYDTHYLGDDWFPYSFNAQLYGDPNDTAVAPWFSGMAQGIALDLFTNLYQVTGDTSWETAADLTFNTFLYPGPGSQPWVDTVDANGYLWIEEYPTPHSDDDTMNGAGFGLWGIVDYALATGSGSAAELASGVLTTFRHYWSVAEQPRSPSSYSLSHLADQIPEYHGIVTLQYASYWSITHSKPFAMIAATLSSDYPIVWLSGEITLKAGTYTMFGGTTYAQVPVPSDTTAPVFNVVKLSGQPGLWWAVGTASDDGIYAGYDIQDVPGSAYLPGWCNEIDWSPVVSGTFPVGTYTEYVMAGGVLTSVGQFTWSSAQSEPVSYHATIDGITVWAISSGNLGGAYITGADPTF